jgi:hypothetical protein
LTLWRRLFAALLALIGLALWWLSRETWWVAGGSDAAAVILAPAEFPQQLALLVLMLAALCCLVAWSSRLSRKLSLIGLWLGVAATALATHRVVIDGARGDIRDVWLLVTVQRIGMDLQQGPRVLPGELGALTWLSFQSPTPGAAPMRAFVGIPPWRLQTDALKAFPGALSGASP